MYQDFVKIIDKVNSVQSTYVFEDTVQESNEEVKLNELASPKTPAYLDLNPSRGNVAFGAGRQNWAFTLSQFARLYA